ncbi:MAG: tetratricopeptide repeat protein [Verrucomicrobium sp.]
MNVRLLLRGGPAFVRTLMLVVTPLSMVMAQVEEPGEKARNPQLTDKLEGPAELTEKIRKAANLLNSDAEASLKLLQEVMDAETATAEQRSHASHGQGEGYMKQKNWEKAALAYEAATTFDPVPAELRALSLGSSAEARLKMGEKDKALSAYTAAVSVPDAPVQTVAKVLMGRAMLYKEVGNLDKAVEDLSTLATASGLDKDQRQSVLLRRADILSKIGKKDAAIRDVTEAMEVKAMAPEQRANALTFIASMHLEKASLQKARDNAKLALETTPEPPASIKAKALYVLAETYSQEGNAEPALRTYQEILELPGPPLREQAVARLQRVAILNRTNRAEAAVAESMVLIDNKDTPPDLLAQALVFRGIDHIKNKRFSEALLALSQAIDLKETEPDQLGRALVDRATIHKQQGRPDEAKRDLQRLIELKGARPDNLAAGYGKLALLAEESGKTEEAIELLTRAILVPNVPAASFIMMMKLRSIYYMQLKKYDFALADADHIRALEEATPYDLAQINAHKASIYGKMNRGWAALQCFNDLLAVPGAPTELRKVALTNRAKIYESVGMKEKAEADRKQLENEGKE